METLFSHNLCDQTTPRLPCTCPLRPPADRTLHQSVASQEFGEESGRGRLVPLGLSLPFGLGLLPSQPQLPLQLLQLRLVQQLKVLHLAVRLLGQLKQPGGIRECRPLWVAQCREADHRFYSLLDGGCDGGGDDVARHLVD